MPRTKRTGKDLPSPPWRPGGRPAGLARRQARRPPDGRPEPRPPRPGEAFRGREAVRRAESTDQDLRPGPEGRRHPQARRARQDTRRACTQDDVLHPPEPGRSAASGRPRRACDTANPALTVGTYTDTKLLDVAGALDVLPDLPLCGPDTHVHQLVAQDVELPPGNEGQTVANSVNPLVEGRLPDGTGNPIGDHGFGDPSRIAGNP